VFAVVDKEGTSHQLNGVLEGFDSVRVLTTRQQVAEAAVRIFELSQTVATKSTPYSMDEDSSVLATTSTEILLSFLITSSMLQMSANNRELCHRYREELMDLLTTHSHQELMLSLDDLPLAAAAA